MSGSALSPAPAVSDADEPVTTVLKGETLHSSPARPREGDISESVSSGQLRRHALTAGH